MARQLQLRRGTTAESTSFIGALGELTVDTSTNQLRLHDGMTPGGHIVGDHTVVVNTANLFDWKWSDHLLPADQDQWVLADANEWIYATDYPDAYQHLVNDFESTRIGLMILFVTVPGILSVIGFILGLTNKVKGGAKTAGIVLNAIALILSIIMVLIIQGL